MGRSKLTRTDRRRAAFAAAVTAIILLGMLTAGQPVRAQSVDEIVAGVEVDSDDLRLIRGELEATIERVQQAKELIPPLEARLEELRLAESQVESSVPGAASAVDRAIAAEDRALDELSILAIAAYLSTPPESQLSAVLAGTERLVERDRAEALHDILTAEQAAILDSQRKRRRDADFALDSALGELGGLRERIRGDEATLALARSTIDTGTAAIPRLEDQLVAARPRAIVVGTDLPLATWEGYFRGARAAAESNPGCNITWPLLAGIGQIESRHGTFQGRAVLPGGAITEPIFGIPLDGTNETRVIEDTDGGLLDGDLVFDRAVGPMQFIPTTWAAYGRDGNGDGVADPQHFWDATRSAAEYLCRAGDLADPATLDAAILSYNRSDTYRIAVLTNMDTYAGFALR